MLGSLCGDNQQLRLYKRKEMINNYKVKFNDYRKASNTR
nr:MAG TPA: hypothetical protein [Caudoviricetes sp.]